MTGQTRERRPGRWSTAWKAAREAGWDADSDEVVKAITFAVVLGKESVLERWRRIFGLRYRREIYLTAAETGELVNVIVSGCRIRGASPRTPILSLSGRPGARPTSLARWG